MTDPTGASFPGVRIRAFDAHGALAGETTSDQAGNYEFAGLPEGQVRLEAEREGFRRTIVSGISVSWTAAAQQHLKLDVGSVQESVQVTAESSQISASISGARARSLGSGSGLGGGSYGLRKAPPASPPPTSSVSAARPKKKS